MKATAALMCVGSLYAGAFWVAYQTALLLGVGCFLVAGASALTLLAAAVYCAPEGHERADRQRRTKETPTEQPRLSSSLYPKQRMCPTT